MIWKTEAGIEYRCSIMIVAVAKRYQKKTDFIM